MKLGRYFIEGLILQELFADDDERNHWSTFIGIVTTLAFLWCIIYGSIMGHFNIGFAHGGAIYIIGCILKAIIRMDWAPNLLTNIILGPFFLFVCFCSLLASCDTVSKMHTEITMRRKFDAQDAQDKAYAESPAGKAEKAEKDRQFDLKMKVFDEAYRRATLAREREIANLEREYDEVSREVDRLTVADRKIGDNTLEIMAAKSHNYAENLRNAKETPVSNDDIKAQEEQVRQEWHIK